MSEEEEEVIPTATWLSLAFTEIEQCSHLNDELCDILRAFGKDDNDAPGPATLNADDSSSVDKLQARISTELLLEIDADQASMFGRRFLSVSTLLQKKDDDSTNITTKQLLRLALHRRTAQILSTTDQILSKRKALRVRGLVDFIWSQSLVLSLKDDPANNTRPTLCELVQKYELQSTRASSYYKEFASGFFHAQIDEVTRDFGPVHINILRININACQMKCLDARNSCTDLAILARDMKAVAAISGGFFLYSEPDIDVPSKRTDPVGLIIEDGNIRGPPVFQRAALLQTGEDSMAIDRIGMDGVTCAFRFEDKHGGPLVVPVTIGRNKVRCFHRGNAEDVTVIEGECGLSIVGSTIVDSKAASSPTTKMSIPLAGFVLIFPPNAIDLMLSEKDVTISVLYELPRPYNNVQNAMAGGPMFFDDTKDSCHTMDLPFEDFKGSAPPVTFSQDETHDHNLLPRMGVGIAKCPESGSKQLVCVAIDGRNLERALGTTLQGTADLLRALGCQKAMNLDGGSSKRMVIFDPEEEHRVVCLSTTEIKAAANGQSNDGSENVKSAEPSRPVHSAIVFIPSNK